jgi:Zn-dependent oligopeptidase
MISKSDTSKKVIEIKKICRMIENRVFNVLNINPVVKIATKYFKDIPQQFENKQGKIIINLTKSNYHTIVDYIDSIDVRHMIEKQYVSRTKNASVDFSKLIISRKLLAERSGFDTYFKYINKNKHDNTDTIKEFIIELNNKINKKLRFEIEKIYHYFLRDKDIEKFKINSSDIIKYIRIHKNNTKFDPKQIITVIFNILNKYFNLNIEKIDNNGWNKNVNVYRVIDSVNKNILGKLYLDIDFDENKKLIDPIAIRLGDKMQINQDNDAKSIPEIAILANYQHNISHAEIILLFKEFGYMISSICYDSRVGLINYDDEFSNYIPSLMECIAWDRDTLQMIVNTLNLKSIVKNQSIIDHIELGRDMDMCYNIKIKCINAKFDNMVHNSSPLLDIIEKSLNEKNDASTEIIETYKNIYNDAMKPIADIFMTDPDTIDPSTMIQEITSSHGLLYANLMNEIFAYATYWILKDKKENSNIVGEFRKYVLDNGVDNYRDLVRLFLKKLDTNCFTLYIKNVVKAITNDEYVVTEDNNYFKEDDGSDDEDEGDIIEITRI